MSPSRASQLCQLGMIAERFRNIHAPLRRSHNDEAWLMTLEKRLNSYGSAKLVLFQDSQSRLNKRQLASCISATEHSSLQYTLHLPPPHFD